MSHSTSTLSQSDVLNYAHSRLAPHLHLTADGYSCSSTQLLHILLGVAASRGSLQSLCAGLIDIPCAATFRQHLNNLLDGKKLPAVETAINAALAPSAELALWLHPQQIAIDYHDQPYYGKSEQDQGLWVRAKAKAGTTRVYRVATAYLILAGRRLTLAIKFVQAKETHTEVLRFLLKRLKALKIKVSCLYLDRGFATVAVVKFLRRCRLRAIIACPLRGGQGGLKALCVGHKSYLTSYHFGGKQERVRVTVALYRAKVKKAKKGRPKTQWLAYLLVGKLEMKAKAVKRAYRKRFGIESSYRCARQVRGFTTSAKAGYRFLLIGLSFVVMNTWVELRWQWAREPRRGRPRVKESHFQLRRLAMFLIGALETLYGKVCHITLLGEDRSSP